MATTQELLNNSVKLDNQIFGKGGDREGERVVPGSSQPMSATNYTDGSPTKNSLGASDKDALESLSKGIEDSIHAFGFNDNNRMVAERVARDEKRLGKDKPVELAKPKTAGEASEEALKQADAYEAAHAEDLPENTVAEVHALDAQRQEILADNMERATKLAKQRPAPPATAPAQLEAPVFESAGPTA